MNDSSWVILKFGGTSVSSLKCFETIKGIIEERRNIGLRPFVVCSAFAKVSNLLDSFAGEGSETRRKEILSALKEIHNNMAAELSVDPAVIKDNFEELERLAGKSPKVKAQIMSHGELMSTKLGHAFLAKSGLKTTWLDARKYLISKPAQNTTVQKSYLSVSCEYEPDEHLQRTLSSEKDNVIITQGFIANNASGETVLLGRGGSDVSGAYFAAKLKAKRCEIWTDVPGIFTANPRSVPNARVIKSLDYEEAQEIVSAGAKVLHPRCLAPVQRYNIPLHIYCVAYPAAGGTVVSKEAPFADAQVKAISTKLGITLISMETVEMWQEAGFLADVFGCFKKHGISIDLVSTSETNVSVTLDENANLVDETALKALNKDLEKFCKVKVIDSCAFLSLAGRNIRSILHHITPALEAFEEQRIYLVSQAANDLNLTFVVDEERVEPLALKVHEELFGQRRNDRLLGPTWKEIIGKGGTGKSAASSAWWLAKRNELLALAEKRTPLYVYDGKTVDDAISRLQGLKSIDRIFYSIKANSNPDLLKKVKDKGLGFECVSPGEVKYVLGLFKDIRKEKILFTPNFGGKNEYEFGFEKGVIVTLDNLYPLEKWSSIFKGREIFVRIDPGEGRGHHKYVHTGGLKSKFGISLKEVGRLKTLVKNSGAHVIGLHAHVGSNIFSVDTWSKTADALAGVADELGDVKYLDIGGGLGVVEKPGRDELEMKEVDKLLGEVKRRRKGYEFWIEPGRYIIAEAGVLLAKVTQIKQKGEYNYVGCDAGMNSLIRPALYGAYHEIVNLTKLDSKDIMIASIVGPICESGDVLGYARDIAVPSEGDVLLIATAGAYGRAMSSNYNMREPAEEVFLWK